MNKFSFFLVLLIFSILLGACGTTANTPITTIREQTAGFHAAIEKENTKKHGSESYQSLSFGKLKVFKPEAFVRLDSIYTIKQNYINAKDLRGLHKSGIEDLIPGYRAEAMQHLDEVQYEIEHIYQIDKMDSLEIHHSFYLFDYKDSLINVSPLYDFKIIPKHKDFYYAYQFNYHFVSNRNFNITESEWEFLRFFKRREIQLIGSEELQPFMDHTMNFMEAAKKASTVDFRKVSKLLIIKHFKELDKKMTIDEFGELMALNRNEEVIGYEFSVEWSDESDGLENIVKKRTMFSFDPYLQITSISTVFQ
ncbi:hypothetical protein [Brumimicrobium mesophilum]|uniref:hypothetical protein n=1 Tax=Brumimicrobium mesophilum TaxID=392717 RepID=UPI000D1406F6|nr:hypothetical protein [Brumimicrobium mesophilum]